MDITTKTILQAEDIYNEAGIKAYMAGMYNKLPMEDFHYDSNANGLQGGYFNNLNIQSTANSTGEMLNRNNVGKQRHKTGYWSEGFKIIRNANMLISDLPKYAETLVGVESWLGEAKFIRAYVYFQLAKRYGGLPLVEEPQQYNSDDVSTLYIARSSHAATYDFILADLDDAIAKMGETSEAGRANKYIAAAFKSRVALHAATTARYGAFKFPEWSVEGVMLEGIPQDRANGYFKIAWDAAKLVEGHYELHNAGADKTANYAEIWEKAETNKETIWIRKYELNNWAHSYDAVMCPPRMVTTYGDRFNPTLDWVELFDGLPLDPATGHFSAFDANGDYIVYDNCHQLWDGAEPRLRANLLLPGETYKGLKLDLRAGIFNKDIDPAVDKFKKFSKDDGADGGNYRSVTPAPYTSNLFADGIIINSSATPNVQTDLYEVDGLKIFKNGQDGPKMSNNGGNSTLTGFHGRKYINLGMTISQTGLFQSTQPWVEIRYGEVLLNRAEAAIELAQSGEPTYAGTDMLQDAFEVINAVRDRAGATLLTSPAELSTEPGYTNWTKPGAHGIGSFVEAPTRGLQIVRVERYKELAFESKIYWDLLRWFTYDTQINNYRKRGLYSFMFSKGATVDASGTPDGKYIYDSKNTEAGSDRITFNVNDYYETIPADELKNNPLLQKNRNQ
ncbi:glycan metabolism protein RagB [Bacteroidia bacterium]|nr:glycan metabolism protein RagB [Bacteroidia bacterium]